MSSSLLFGCGPAGARGWFRRTFHARFGRSRNHPEYNPTRFALSRDGKILVSGCNGGCIVDWVSGKQIRTYVRSR